MTGRAESRWQSGSRRSLHLPTTRAPMGHWWRSSMPKEMGGTPELPSRTQGGLRGEEKWRPDRTSAPEGWLGEGRGSHIWRDPWGLGGSGGSAASVSPAQSAPGSLLCSQAGSSPSNAPSGCIGPWGVGGRGGKKRRGGGGGDLRDQRIRGD